MNLWNFKLVVEGRKTDKEKEMGKTSDSIAVSTSRSGSETGTGASETGNGETRSRHPAVFPIFRKTYKPKHNLLQSIQQTIQKSTPRRKKRSLLGTKETPGLSQMVLDAGQKHIGPRLCADCGLLYSPGDIQDEEEHRKAHARLENLHTITLWKNPKILAHFSDGGYITVVRKQGESKRVLNRLQNFIEWVDSELCCFSDADREKPTDLMFFYLFPTKRKNSVRILGYASMEVLEKDTTVAHLVTEPEDSVLQSNVPLLIGVTRLWTDKIFRKKKIASRLVEAMRFHNGIPGCIVPKEKLGILEPSEDARAFMIKYSQSKAYSYTYKL